VQDAVGEEVEMVRLAPAAEDFVAEQAAERRVETDMRENDIADEAERILTRFVSSMEVLHLPAPTNG